MIDVFLGYPPEYIGKWIEKHYSKKEEKYMGPLCFTAQEDGATVGMVGPFNPETETNDDITVSLQISKDEQKTWDEWDGSIVNLNTECENGKLYVKALNPNEKGLYNENLETGHQFVIRDGKVAASGNIQYLLTQDGSRTDVPNGCYSYMFCDCTSLVSAPQILPAETLTFACYSNMFYGCTSLTSAPELPATTLAWSCYNGMFSNCKSLTQTPELPATTLAGYCYYYMFFNCTSLVKAPKLPAETLADDCYYYMFSGCTSLTQAPELPATTLAGGCYVKSFDGCTNINSVTMKNAVNGVYNPSIHGTLKSGITIKYVD